MQLQVWLVFSSFMLFTCRRVKVALTNGAFEIYTHKYTHTNTQGHLKERIKEREKERGERTFTLAMFVVKEVTKKMK